MSFKIKNANAIVRPATQHITILGLRFPKLPHLLSGEMLDFLRIRREKITGERMGLEMFASLALFRLPESERIVEFQNVDANADGQQVLEKTTLDLGDLETVLRLPLTPEEIAELVAGSLELLMAGLGATGEGQIEQKAAAEEGKSTSLTLDVINPCLVTTTVSTLNDSLTSPGPQPSST